MKVKFADTILINGRFLTMEEDYPTAEAVAIAGERILYVGTENEARKFATEGTEIIDLEGRVAAPGLIECHTHVVSYAVRFCNVNVAGEKTRSLSAVLAALKERAERRAKGEWIVAEGYDESKFAEGPIEITKEMLDEVAPEHPVLLRRTCGHICVLNSLALKLSNFTDDSVDPEAGGHFFRDEKGRLTGMISESLQRQVPFELPSTETIAESFLSGTQREFFEKGITAATEMELRARALKPLELLDRKGQLKLKVGFNVAGHRNSVYEPMLQQVEDLGIQSGFGSAHLRFMGLKFIMDGSTGGKTAAFAIPSRDDPENYGELNYKQEDLNRDILKAARTGAQVSIHAIGDRAIEMAITALEYANENGADIPHRRVRLEHLESPSPEQIERIKKLNVVVALSAAFIYALGDSHLNVLGYDRTVDAFPAKSLMDSGIVVGCNSDCPVCDVNPMRGIYAMVTRKTEKGQSFGGEKQAIDRIRALEAYTRNSAYIICREDELGTLKAGKFADIVVFEDDYLNVPEESLKDIKVYMTLSDGEIVYRKK